MQSCKIHFIHQIDEHDLYNIYSLSFFWSRCERDTHMHTLIGVIILFKRYTQNIQYHLAETEQTHKCKGESR